MNTENVFAAFAALMGTLGPQGSGLFNTVERKWQMIEDVDPSAMPYLGIKEVGIGVRDRSNDGIETWLLKANVIVYVNNPDTTQPSSPLFNPLFDAISNLLPPQAFPLPETDAGVQFNAYLKPGVDNPIFENWIEGKSALHLFIEIIAPDNA